MTFLHTPADVTTVHKTLRSNHLIAQPTKKLHFKCKRQRGNVNKYGESKSKHHSTVKSTKYHRDSNSQRRVANSRPVAKIKTGRVSQPITDADNATGRDGSSPFTEFTEATNAKH